jgi:hypothetical protein
VGCLFLDRQAFASQSRLRGLQRDLLDQPCVGGKGVSFLDQDDIARDKLGGRNCPPSAIPDDVA